MLYAGSAFGMHNESRAHRLKQLREMGMDNKAANRNMQTLAPADSPDQDRTLMLDLIQRKFNKLKEEHEESVALIQQSNKEQFDRFFHVINRQTDTIASLNLLMKNILKQMYRTDVHVRNHDQEISEVKQMADSHIDNLLRALEEETEVVSRQNRALKEMLGRIDKQKVQLQQQNLKIQQQDIQIANQGRLLARVRMMVLGITKRLDNADLDNLIKFCEKELQGPDLPVVESEKSDPDIYRQVLGSNVLENSDGMLTLQADANSEEIERVSVRLLKEKDPTQDPFENEPPRDSDGEKDDDDEIIEEEIIVEELSKESLARHARKQQLEPDESE